MASIRGLERWAILAAVVLVAACGSSGTASPTPPPVLATAQATSTALPTPPPTQAQAWPGGSLPPGVTVVDEANIIQRLDWSPSGKLLAVLAWGGEWGTGRVDVLDLSSHKIASFDAFDMAWVDDTHIMTLVVSPNDTAHGTATVQSIDGSGITVVPGTFGGILGNGHGSVALSSPVAASEAPAKESFQVWSNGQLGPRIAGYGYPMVWAPDGRLLALVGETSTGGGANGVGGPTPGTLRVLKLPEKTVVLSRPLADIRGLDASFSPDGTSLATSDGVVDLADGSSMKLTGQPEGWTASGSLVVVGQDQRVSLWTPAGTAVVPNAFEWAVFGPNAGDVATLPAADQNPDNPFLPTTAVVRRAGSSAPIPLDASVQVTTWSSSGICFMTTGTADAQAGDDRLLRIELPAS